MPLSPKVVQYGKVFSDWTILKEIGKGSGGETKVYQIVREDIGLKEFCALKVVPIISERGKYEDLSDYRKEEYQKALSERKAYALHEVRYMAQVGGHTNTVNYHDYKPVEWGFEDKFGCDLLIRMEFLHSLRARMDEEYIGEEETIRIGRDICEALVLCHKNNIVHRDIKPENIFFNNSKNYKLGDFGISRIMDKCSGAYATTSVSTAAYLAPEQLSGRYDERVDIYSLGLVLYELRNQNLLPFASSPYLNDEDVKKRLREKTLPAPCSASNDFAKVILKACAHEPADRYQSAQEMLDALNQLGNAEPEEQPGPSVVPDLTEATDLSFHEKGYDTEMASLESSSIRLEPEVIESYTTVHAKLSVEAEQHKTASEVSYALSTELLEQMPVLKQIPNRRVYAKVLAGISLCLALAIGGYTLLKMLDSGETANADALTGQISNTSQQFGSAPTSPAANSLLLSETALEIKVGSTAQLDFYGETGEVVWTSSDENIATVENGEVKGVFVGVATITATVGDKTASCSVTIKSKNPKRESFFSNSGVLMGYLISTYDEFGRESGVTSYDADGNQTGHEDCIFDKNGNLIQQPVITSSKNSDGAHVEQVDAAIVLKYDELGRKIEETYKLHSGEYHETKYYTYEDTATGYKVIEVSSSTDGSSDSHTTLVYTSDEHVIREERYYIYDGEQKLSTYTTYEYDALNHLTQEKLVGFNDILLQSRIYTYDDAGKMIRYVYNQYNNTGTLEATWEGVYQRGESGEILGCQHYTDGVLDYYVEYSEVEL